MALAKNRKKNLLIGSHPIKKKERKKKTKQAKNNNNVLK